MNYKYGLTIIELMIAILIIATVSIFGYNIYSNYQIKTNRNLAKQTLLENILILEQSYIKYPNYNFIPLNNFIQDDIKQGSQIIYKIFIKFDGQYEYYLVAIPQIDSIQAKDGYICANRHGTIKWPATSC